MGAGEFLLKFLKKLKKILIAFKDLTQKQNYGNIMNNFIQISIIHIKTEIKHY